MTTRVTITLAEKHIPVVVEVLRNDGTISSVTILNELDQMAQDYVHSGQHLRVREMTSEEVFTRLQKPVAPQP